MHGLRSLLESAEGSSGADNAGGSEEAAAAGAPRDDAKRVHGNHALLMRVRRNACSDALSCLRLDEAASGCGHTDAVFGGCEKGEVGA